MSFGQTTPHGETAWADRYERLRQHALGGAAPAGCFSGLEVLLQNGVAIWMRTAPNGMLTENASAPPCRWLVPDQEATTLVLAEMALSQFVQLNRRN